MDHKKDREGITFMRDVQLDEMDLQVDMIIRKKRDAVLDDDIGSFFRMFNLIDSKDESLDINGLSYMQACACFFKSGETASEKRPLDEVTITFFRKEKPISLIQYLKEHNIEITEREPGIYSITKAVMFPTQIVVMKELNPKEYPWIHLVTGGVTEQEMREALIYARSVTDKRERDLLNSVLDASMYANPDIIESIKESADMFEVLRDLFQPEIDAVQKESDQRIAQAQQEIQNLQAENQRLQAEVQRLKAEEGTRC